MESHIFLPIQILRAQVGDESKGKVWWVGRPRVSLLSHCHQARLLVTRNWQEARQAAEAARRASTGLRGRGKDVACPAGVGKGKGGSGWTSMLSPALTRADARGCLS